MKSLNKPFFEWNEWIKEQLALSLKQYKEKKFKRLIDIGKNQAAKLIRKVSESQRSETSQQLISNHDETQKKTKKGKRK